MRVWPLTVRLRPSLRLLIVYATMHCIVAFSLLLSDAPPWLRIAGVLVVGLSFVSAWRSERNKRRLSLVLHADGRAHYLVDAARVGDALDAVRGVDGGYALWLTGRRSRCWRRQSLMLVAGNLHVREDWRVLRIWLRLLASSPDGERELSVSPDANRGV